MSSLHLTLITHADASRVSIAIIRVCVCVFVCLSVCPYDKTQTAESAITKFAKKILHFTSHRPPINIRSKGQRSRSQGHKVQKHIEDARVDGVSYALY